MRILITGICGFVGSALARELPQHLGDAEVFGLDNLSRLGSELNRARFKRQGVRVFHGDVRCASDLDSLPPADWVIDASANPSVLAGVDGKSSSRQLVENNLLGTVNLLEHCRRHRAGFALVSTSRVYSVVELLKIPLRAASSAFEIDSSRAMPAGCSRDGIDATFSVRAPVSLYGASKLASETLALEYAHTFEMPVVIDRCGVMAGGEQFGTAEQGIFSFWIRSYAARRPMKYLGFSGSGLQVRDALHPRDLAALLAIQLRERSKSPEIWNVGGGAANAMSLAQLSEWCAARFGPHNVQASPDLRRWDIPWLVMDNRAVSTRFNWQAKVSLEQILDEIARHHRDNPDFLELSTPS